MKLITIKRIALFEIIALSLMVFYFTLTFEIITDQNILSLFLSILIQTIVFGLIGKISYDQVSYSKMRKNKRSIISVVVMMLSRYKSNYLDGKDIDSVNTADFISEIRKHYKYATYDDYSELEYIISNDLSGLISFSALASSIDDSHLFCFHILCGNISALSKSFYDFNMQKKNAPIQINIRLNIYKKTIDQHIDIVIKSLESFENMKIEDFE